MSRLEVIAATLRRQRQDLDELRDHTAVRRGETARLLEKIEELRQRAESAMHGSGGLLTPRRK